MRSLPIGIQDFKDVRSEDFYYVDKSMLIGQILDQNRRGIFLYTRPRRFGKSLNLSMIDAFFNIKYTGNTWFDGLEISKHAEYNAYRNSFPVISVDFRCGSIYDYEGFLEDMRLNMSDLFDRYNYLLDSDRLSESKKEQLKLILAKKGTEKETARALSGLCAMLEDHHGAKVVVLIDEYDNAVNNVKDPELRHRIISYIREAMSPLLKGNSSLQMGVLTGIMQIAKENIFSGLNNLYVNNILDVESDEMFGFTDDEVRRICADYGRPERFEEAKEWYDGYRFGNADIYNPWSILNYVQRKFDPKPYWVNTSSNSIIASLLEQADDGTLENLRVLGSGEGVLGTVRTTVTFDDLSEDPEMIYSMMVVSGYLKAVPDGGDHRLSIPNRELFSVFADTVARYALGGEGPSRDLRRFCGAVLAGDAVMMEKTLYSLLAGTVSSRVLGDEHSYQAFVAGLLLTLSGRYEVTADFEAGRGYYDIRMERKSGSGPNVVMELKRSDGESSLQTDAERAMAQIKGRDYAHGLEGRTILYGISFFGKVPYIVSEVL